MNEYTVPATVEALPEVISFVEAELQRFDCPVKPLCQILIAVEEIYVNIARYAYYPDVGEATIRCMVYDVPLRVTVQFLDRGKPFNPPEKSPPDLSLSAEEREPGGLGIMLVVTSMTDVHYEYKEGLNILTVEKRL
jgi:anti-sigma regulatory factor (Ser/Thr protein kinase)